MSKLKIAFLIAIHLLFWGLSYVFVTQSEISWSGLDNVNGGLTIAYAYGLVFNASIFYIHVFWLVPKFYMQHETSKFWLYAIGVLILFTGIETAMDLNLANSLEVVIIDNKEPSNLFYVFILLNTLCHFFYSVVGFLYRFQFEYFKSEKSKSNLLLETREAELKYLRAQLNPHFLFNAINSVYHLIGKNDPLAKNTLLQFSDLLRYQLYESNTQHISLEKELDYVLQYIKIEALRKGEDISFDYNIQFENASKNIVPLLLTPFIENAFKHCSSYSKSTDNTIEIAINEEDGRLTLEVTNTFDAAHTNKTKDGLGLSNVKRRLMLLYPASHELEIDTKNGIFSVCLTLNI